METYSGEEIILIFIYILYGFFFTHSFAHCSTPSSLSKEYRIITDPEEKKKKVDEIHHLFMKPNSEFPLLVTATEREKMQEDSGADR